MRGGHDPADVPPSGGTTTKGWTRAALAALALAVVLSPDGSVRAGPMPADPIAIAAAGTFSPLAGYAESTVAPGVAWRSGSWATTGGVQAVHLVEVDAAGPAISLVTSSPAGGVDGRETVRTQARRVSRDGHRVVAAINGDVFRADGGGDAWAPIGLQVRAGELLTAGSIARPTLGLDAAEVPRLSDVIVRGRLTLPDGSTTLAIDRINKPRRSGDLVLYTRRWGASTSTLADGVEVVLSGAALPLRVTGTWTATVATVVRAGGDTPIPTGALVLSAQGTDASLLGSLRVGSAVTISTAITPGWEGVTEAVGGREWLVEDGAIGIRPVSTITTDAHPRTAVGIRADGRLLLATVDGRRPGYSIGVTAADLAGLLLAEGAIDAAMLDGGGSTTALVRRPGDIEATVVNRPSDGKERAVANALLVVSSVPTGPLAGIALRPGSATMVVGQAVTFSAHGVDAAVNGVPLPTNSTTWSMSGAGGTLSSDGRFRAREPGSATVTATTGGLTGTSPVTVVADTFPPVADRPALRLRRAATVEAGSVPVTISWTAAMDIGTGVARYELRRRLDGGSWTGVALGSPTARKVNQRLPPGHTIQYQVRAVDRAGNIGAWRSAAALRIRLVSEASSSVRYRSTWRKRLGVVYLGGAVRMARAAGATATLTFTGRQVAWIATRSPTRGSARVLVDGSVVDRVSLWSGTLKPRQMVFTSAWGPTDRHRITIRVSGTAGHPHVDVDGFVIVEPDDLSSGLTGVSEAGP